MGFCLDMIRSAKHDCLNGKGRTRAVKMRDRAVSIVNEFVSRFESEK